MSITIEVTEDIVEKFIQPENSYVPKDLPYKEFEVIFPYRVFQTEQQLLEVVLSEYPSYTLDPIQYSKVQMYTNRYTRANARLTVKEENGIYYFTLYSPQVEIYSGQTGSILISFSIMDFMPFPKIIENNFTKSEAQTCIMLGKIIRGVADHFNNPTTVKEKTDTRERSNSPKTNNGQQQGNKKSYVYRTIYKFKNIDTVVTTPKEYNRIQDVWQVRGHFRHYKKSGKIIWVDEYIKGDKSKLKDVSKEYKITRA